MDAAVGGWLLERILCLLTVMLWPALAFGLDASSLLSPFYLYYGCVESLHWVTATLVIHALAVSSSLSDIQYHCIRACVPFVSDSFPPFALSNLFT